mgnify:CR=1 FL=1
MAVRFARDGLKAGAAAFKLLTRLPVPVRTDGGEAENRRSAVFFPVVGLAVGLIAGSAGGGIAHVLPLPVAAVAAVLVWIGLSGGLHLDGLMDTADGLFSHRPPERMLEIMKDSRAGPMGVMACVFDLLFKVTLVYALLGCGFAPLLAGVTAAAVLGRAFVPAAMALWPYARKEGGLGGLFRSVGKGHAAAAGALGAALVTAVFLGIGGLAPAIALLIAVPGTASIYAIGAAVAAAIARKLGGLTGDVYGALIEALEIAALLGFVAALHAGGAAF